MENILVFATYIGREREIMKQEKIVILYLTPVLKNMLLRQ